MKFKTGQSVIINPGRIDDETGTDIGGWCGRVSGFDGSLLEIALDSITLQNMPAEYVISSIDGGYDYFNYVVEPKDVSAVPPRDEPEDVKAMRKKLEAHYESYATNRIVPPPFSAGAPAGPGQTSPVRDFRQALLATLQAIKGSGAFAAAGAFDMVPPGLVVEGLGEIGLPVTPLQAQALIAAAGRAPFGKGSRTLTDTTVRSAWEIDAARVSFANPAWEKLMQQILGQVKTELGLEKDRIGASLYKLLVYESGDFFLPHKDSEKEAGMFGTLVVGLPGAHTGGVLCVRFDGKEKRIDFSGPASSYRIPFAAFYADCEHEIEPVTSGYRVCLVYNLVHQSKSARPRTPQLSAQVAAIAHLLEGAEAGFDEFPSAVLLGHQYTPANFALAQLKLDDRPRAEALLAAAEKAGYFAKLGLVTHYRMGDLEGDLYYDYFENEKKGTMGDIYEEYTTIEYWADDGGRPGLGNFNLRDSGIIGEVALGEGEPDEQEQEGFTGNAGMTIEYWYHYGAVFLWPKRTHGQVLAQLKTAAQLQWLDFYARHWDDPELEAGKHAKAALLAVGQPLPQKDEKTYQPLDYSPAAAALARLQDEKFLRKTGLKILAGVFSLIKPKQWAGLLKRYDPELFHPAFQEAAASKSYEPWHHLLEVLVELDGQGCSDFVSGQLAALPPLLEAAAFFKGNDKFSAHFSWDPSKDPRQAALSAIVKNLLALSHHREADPQWREQALDALFGQPCRAYVNDVLIPVLLADDCRDTLLANDLRRACREDLHKRAAAEPAPPLDWKRKTPSDKTYKGVWDILRPFLSSPTQRVFDYRAAEAARKQMEYAIRSVDIDLETETISLGRPYTLRLTKTLAAYERARAQWKEDVGLLERVEGKG